MKNTAYWICCAILINGLSAHIWAVTAGDPVAGQRKTKLCNTCHNIDGNSVAEIFPKLAGQNIRYLLDTMLAIKEGRRAVPEMIDQLDEFNRRDLLDIATFYAQQTMTGGAAVPENIALGSQLYRSGDKKRKIMACTACHSPLGRGNPLAGFPFLAGQHAAYIVKRLRNYRGEKCARDQSDCIMPLIARKMNDEEIEAVANYIVGLRK